MRRSAVAVVLAACASAGDPKPATDAPPTGDGSNVVANMCANGQFAVAVAADGKVTCAPITAPTRAAIDASCSTYLGWRDGCDGCTTPPAKWGRSGATCANGLGADNTCTMQTLGGDTFTWFGLNSDGDVDGNDKLYGSLHCAPPAPTANNAPCPSGEYVTGLYGSSWTCGSLAVAVVDYVRSSCSLWLGWQDGCDGCTNAPAKWGFASDKTCMNGAGADNTCTIATLDTEQVNLFGLNFDGDVDNNDKIHVGLHCAPPPPIVSTQTMTCPAGQFVSGTATDASFQCTSAAPLFHDYFTQHCAIYFGWRDGCDGCTLPPAKWGKVGVGSCTLGAGADDTCGKFTFATTTIDMFGLNPDGDVDGNDTMFATLRCN